MNGKKELVSVIIPVRNGSAYLAECLNAVRAQTYEDLEILVADDASEDGTGKILEAQAAEDARIHPFYLEHRSGQGAVRNFLLRHAHGAFYAFADADDVPAADMVETLYGLVTAEHADLAVCRFQTRPGFRRETSSRTELCGGREALLRFLKDPSFGAFSWNKLFRADFFRGTGLLYPEGMFYEDVVLIPQLCMAAEKVAVTDRSLYYYRQHAASVVGTGYSSAKLDQVKAYEMLVPALLRKYPDLKGPVFEKAFFGVMGVWNMVLASAAAEPGLPETLRRKALHYRSGFRSADCTQRRRLAVFDAGLRFPSAYRRMLKIFLMLRKHNLTSVVKMLHY